MSSTSLIMLGLALTLVGCEQVNEGNPRETGDTGDGSADPGDFPEDPSPFTLQVTGAEPLSLTFDEPTCYRPSGSSNFRAFWRNAAQEHVFFLLAEVLGDFEGPGTYDAGEVRAQVKLQEEAGGQGRYFASALDTPGAASITVEGLEDDRAWGEVEVQELTGEGGAVTLSPQPIPIWCPSLN